MNGMAHKYRKWTNAKLLPVECANTPYYSYKLTGVQRYGLDVAFSEAIVDQQKKSVRFCFADGNSRDGVGDLLEIGGIRTERHRLNPIVLFDHGKNYQLPIGLAEDPETGLYTIELDPISKKAFVTAYFYTSKNATILDKNKEYDHALFCDQLFDLMARKYIRGGSIGYQAVKAMPLGPDYSGYQPAQDGAHLLVVMMLEASAVILPAHMNTVAKMLAMPTICGKPPSPWLVKSLEGRAPPKTKTVTGYRGKSQKDFDKFPYGKIEDENKAIDENQGASDSNRASKPEDKKPGAATEEHKPPAQERSRRGRAHGTMRQGNNEAFTIQAPPFVLGDTSEGLKSYIPGGEVAVQRELDKEPRQWKGHTAGCHCTRCRSILNEDHLLMARKKWSNSLANTSGVKSMQENKKGTPAEQEAKTPEDGGVHPEGQENENTETGNFEPYGAQVLRSVHEDHSILMQEYDSLLQQVEHPKVRKLMEKILGNLESTLSTVESIFGSDYAQLNGLEGPGDMDGNGDGESPTGDEAVEGMRQQKRLVDLARKSLRRQYITKSLDSETASQVKNFIGEQTTEVETTKPSGELSATNKEPMQQHTESIVPGGASGSKGIVGLGLKSYESSWITEAKNFLTDLADAKNLGSDLPFRAYHYQKLLEPVLQRVKQFPAMDKEDEEVDVTKKNFIGEQTTEVETTKPSGDLTIQPNSDPMQQHTESVVPGGTSGSKWLPLVKALEEANTMLKSLASSALPAGFQDTAKSLVNSLSKGLEAINEAVASVDVTKPDAPNPASALGSEPMQQDKETVVPNVPGVSHKNLDDPFKDTRDVVGKNALASRKLRESLENLTKVLKL